MYPDVNALHSLRQHEMRQNWESVWRMPRNCEYAEGSIQSVHPPFLRKPWLLTCAIFYTVHRLHSWHPSLSTVTQGKAHLLNPGTILQRMSDDVIWIFLASISTGLALVFNSNEQTQQMTSRQLPTSKISRIFF